MFLRSLYAFSLLIGLISSVQPPQKVYNLRNHLEIFIFNQESFLICPEIIMYRDWPYMLFGDFVINIGYKAAIDLGSLEPSYKVRINWTDQLNSGHINHEGDDNSLLGFLIPSQVQNKIEEVILSNNSRVIFSLPLIPKTCFAVFDIKPDLMGSGSFKIYSKLEFDRRRLIQSIVGLLILICAESMASSILFYYISGVSIVIFSSIMLVFIVLLRLMPMRRAGAYLQSVIFLFSGTLSLMFLFIDYLRSAFVQIMISKWEFVLGYVLIVSLCSLVILYWLQLPEKLVGNYPRTKVVTKLLFRLVGALLFVYSIRLPFLSLMNVDSLTLFEHYLSFSSTFNILNKYPETCLRFFLAIFINILYSIAQRTSKYPSSKPQYPPKFPVDHGDPKAPQHYIAGSPWASSSPYHHSFGFVGKRDTPYGFYSPHGDPNVEKNNHSQYRGYNPWTPERFSVNRRHSYVSRRDSQHEILTDDED